MTLKLTFNNAYWHNNKTFTPSVASENNIPVYRRLSQIAQTDRTQGLTFDPRTEGLE